MIAVALNGSIPSPPIPERVTHGRGKGLERKNMTVPTVSFPVNVRDIPDEVAKLTTFIKHHEAELKIARQMLSMVREGCDHKGAQTGYNDRDGSWMNPCPHCGLSK